MIGYCVLSYVGLGLLIIINEDEKASSDLLFWLISPILCIPLVYFAIKFWYNDKFDDDGRSGYPRKPWEE